MPQCCCSRIWLRHRALHSTAPTTGPKRRKEVCYYDTVTTATATGGLNGTKPQHYLAPKQLLCSLCSSPADHPDVYCGHFCGCHKATTAGILRSQHATFTLGAACHRAGCGGSRRWRGCPASWTPRWGNLWVRNAGVEVLGVALFVFVDMYLVKRQVKGGMTADRCAACPGVGCRDAQSPSPVLAVAHDSRNRRRPCTAAADCLSPRLEAQRLRAS